MKSVIKNILKEYNEIGDHTSANDEVTIGLLHKAFDSIIDAKRYLEKAMEHDIIDDGKTDTVNLVIQKLCGDMDKIDPSTGDENSAARMVQTLIGEVDGSVEEEDAPMVEPRTEAARSLKNSRNPYKKHSKVAVDYNPQRFSQHIRDKFKK